MVIRCLLSWAFDRLTVPLTFRPRPRIESHRAARADASGLVNSIGHHVLTSACLFTRQRPQGCGKSRRHDHQASGLPGPSAVLEADGGCFYQVGSREGSVSDRADSAVDRWSGSPRRCRSPTMSSQWSPPSHYGLAAMWSRLRWRCWRRPRWRRPCGEWRTGTHAWSCTRQPIGCGQQEAGIKGAGGPTAAGRRSSSVWRCWLRRPRSAGAWPRTGISALDSCRLTCARPRFGLQLGLSSVGSWGGRQRLGRGLTPAALDDHAVMILHTTSRPTLRVAAYGGRPHGRGGRGHRRPHRRAGRGRPHRHALHHPVDRRTEDNVTGRFGAVAGSRPCGTATVHVLSMTTGGT
jgi:hypothetical protein